MFRTVIAPELIAENMLEHYHWIIDLEKQGKVFASGPLFDEGAESGVGMTVFRVDSWEETRSIAATDPFITSGAMEFKVQRWQVNEGRISVSVDFSDQTFQFS